MCVQIKPIPRDVIEDIIREVEAKRAINLMPDWPAVRPSAFPGYPVSLILPEGKTMVADTKIWGYLPPWSKRPIVNTRSDTAMNPENRFWRDSIHKRRCIIPTFGFYEPHRSEKTTSAKTGKPIKQQYFFTTHNSPVTFVGGIYQNDRFSMMTVDPLAAMEPIHNRMPLVLLQHELDTWLYSNDFPSLFDRSKVELDITKAA